MVGIEGWLRGREDWVVGGCEFGHDWAVIRLAASVAEAESQGSLFAVAQALNMTIMS